MSPQDHKESLLIVDDEASNAKILVELLRHEYVIRVATNGERALQIAQSESPPDLILLDVLMPGLNGYEVCKQLKANPLTASIPVIFITSKNDEADEVEGFNAGAVDYVTKPFRPVVVRARVKAHVELKIKTQALQQTHEELSHSYEELKRTKIQLSETQSVALMSKVFEKFVPQQYLTRIAPEGIASVEVGKTKKENMAILFSDIRSFTSIAERMLPEDLFKFLNNYLNHMLRPINSLGGFVDKFIGDAIMALFDKGTPSQQATAAIQAALEMQKELHHFNNLYALNGKQTEIGIGLHLGSVIIGTLGNELRMDSTALGDTVNIASRLEGLTKTYRCSLIVSSDFFQLLEPQPYDYRELDWIKVKGKDRPLQIYEIFSADSASLKDKKRELLPLYRRGLKAYYACQWAEAIAEFESCLLLLNEDAPSQILLARAQHFQNHPPNAEWKGIHSFEAE